MSNLLPQTPSQTVGPFFAFSLTAREYGNSFYQIADGRIARDSTPGMRISVTGRVTDGAGEPIPDAMIEIWQADATGHYASASDFVDPLTFHGFGRVGTGSDPLCRFTIETIKPGRHGAEAPHLNVVIFMRGLLLHAYTRMYFSDEEQANAGCPILTLVPPERRHTLLAIRRDEAHGVVYDFDIRMQGENETVFFDI
jgi:protocatechuate 3,4-dioxygenase, alpha subunit